MAGPRRLSDLVSSAGERLRLPRGELVVALSGGADSAALALLAVGSDRTARALHIDHGFTHSAHMRAGAEKVAAALGLQLQVVEVVVEEGPSPEGQAREARYLAFADATTSVESLLTAHTREDSVETIIINLVRGTGPTGLSGIPYFRPPNVYRPILEVSRAETREIATLAGLDFVDDPMNFDPNLTRNLVRREVIPTLAQLNPSMVEAVARLSGQVREDDELLDRLAEELRPHLEAGSASIPIGMLITAPRPLTDRVLARMIGHVAGSDRVDVAAVERARSVLAGETAGQQIASAAVARREGPLLVVTVPDRPDRDDGSEVELAGSVGVGSLVFEVTERGGVCRVAPLSKWSALFPAGTRLTATSGGIVLADGEPAWVPGEKRLPVAWYDPGTSGYLVVSARRRPGWTSNP